MTGAVLLPGGGDVKIESQKLNFKEKAQAKVGSLDNMGHLPAGGAVKVVSGSPWGQLGPGGVRGGVWVPVGGRCHRRSVSSEVMSPHHCCFPIIIRPGRGRRGRGPSRRQPSENRALPAFLSSSLPFSETLWLGHRSPQGEWAARYLSPATSREEVWAHAPCKSVRLAWGQSGMCSAARDSSVTAGLVWACLRRACLRPARARALGEGSGDRASR